MRTFVGLWRLLRVLVHVLHGMAIVALRFPALDVQQRQQRIGWWSCGLLRAIGVQLVVDGEVRAGANLVVANHVSWLDIPALHAVCPRARFVSKADVRRWPLLGWLIGAVGTLFIERERRRDTHRVNRQVAQALEEGDIVAVFPEGTVTDGTDVLPFKGSLLQPIVDTAGHVQPVAIRYRAHDGAPSTVPAYVEDVTFMGSLWRICGERALVVELMALPPVAARQQHRRGLARRTECAIRAALALPVHGSAPDRHVDPAVASP